MELLLFLESLRNPIANTFFEFVTFFGSQNFLLPLICLIYWCINKDIAYKLSFSFFTSGLFIQALKVTFRIPRPWVRWNNLHPYEAAVPGATGYSFPSGHTQGAASFFSSLGFHFKKNIAWILSGSMIALVIFSRLYLGVHTLQDVLISFVLTFLLTLGISKIYYTILTDEKKRPAVAFILLALSLFTLLYSFYSIHTGAAKKDALDCLKAGAAGIGFSIGWYLEKTYINFSETTGSPLRKTIRFMIGLCGVLVIKSGVKVILGPSMAADIIRYTLLVLWIVAIYPYFLKKISQQELQ